MSLESTAYPVRTADYKGGRRWAACSPVVFPGQATRKPCPGVHSYRHLRLAVAEDLVFGPSAASDLCQLLADITCSMRRGNVPLNSCQSELELM